MAVSPNTFGLVTISGSAAAIGASLGKKIARIERDRLEGKSGR